MVPVELEKRDQCNQRFPLVAVNECLRLRDPVSKNSGLKGKIRALIVRIAHRPAKRAFQGLAAP